MPILFLPMFSFAMFKGYTLPEMTTGITGTSDFKQFCVKVCGQFQHCRLLHDFPKIYDKQIIHEHL